MPPANRRNRRPGDKMLVMLSELIDRLVSNYDINLKYIETDATDPSSYIYVFTASRHADLYIKTRSDQKDLARLLAEHEIAHLTHINDLIAGYREITETEKLSDADIFSGQYLDADIVHFAANQRIPADGHHIARVACGIKER
jgi:hypothetical protein